MVIFKSPIPLMHKNLALNQEEKYSTREEESPHGYCTFDYLISFVLALALQSVICSPKSDEVLGEVHYTVA